jgi:hypothetical protein
VQKYVIAMKSGNAFTVEIKDMFQFVEEMKSIIKPESMNNFYTSGGVMFNINDVSAIYPLSAQHGVHPTAAGVESAGINSESGGG